MPDPIEILLDPVSIAVFALYAGLMFWEAIAPARELPRIPGSYLRGLGAFAGYFYLSSYLPLIWDGFFAAHRLLDLTSFGIAGGTVLGLLAYEAGVYVWHRAMHESNVLWRGLHQMHHSTERLDSYSAFYFSPLDMAGWTLVGSLVLTLGIGVAPQAATLILLSTTFMTIFTHANVKTPRWLGYLIHRPESHAVHHARGLHAYNYSDLAIFDMLFGTFRNPATFEHESGFYDGASARIADMLAFRDVSEPEVSEAAAECSVAHAA